jgi:hypothetical protein
MRDSTNISILTKWCHCAVRCSIAMVVLQIISKCMSNITSFPVHFIVALCSEWMSQSNIASLCSRIILLMSLMLAVIDARKNCDVTFVNIVL